MVREYGLVLPLVRPDADRVSAFGRGYTVEEVPFREEPEERGVSACGSPAGGRWGTGRPHRRVWAVVDWLRIPPRALNPGLLGEGIWVGKGLHEICSQFRWNVGGSAGWAGD